MKLSQTWLLVVIMMFLGVCTTALETDGPTQMVSLEDIDEQSTPEELFTKAWLLELSGIPTGEQQKADKWYLLAYEKLKPLAESGDIEAQEMIASIYKLGRGVPEDHATAEFWYSKIYQHYSKQALAGNPKAQLRLAQLLTEGLGTTKDLKTALNWLQKAADNGSPVVIYKVAKEFKRGPLEDENKYILRLTQAAEAGYPEAQQDLGSHFEQKVKDLDKAIYWLTKAAEQDNLSASFILGRIYQYDIKNSDLALKWYTKAAENGGGNAQRMLGRMYFNGWGVKKDIQRAIYWFSQKDFTGQVAAPDELAQIYLRGNGVHQDLEKGKEWLKIAVDAKYPQAQQLWQEYGFYNESSTTQSID